MPEQIISILGLIVFVGVAVLLSENRKLINWQLVAWGVGLQFLFAVLILKTEPGKMVFVVARTGMDAVLGFSEVGAKFLFGKLTTDLSIGAIMAFKVLPVIIFTSSLMAVLYYFKIIQVIVKGMAFVMRKTMKASGLEAVLAAMFVFMGIEAVTSMRAYIKNMTRSELFSMMVAFMSTIAGSVMAIYASFGADAGHLLAASVMSAPAAIALSKIMVPESAKSLEYSGLPKSIGISYSNPIEAAADGAAEGLKLALNIGAMLLAFISLIALINAPLKMLNFSMEKILGTFFVPFAYMSGVPLKEASSVGQLLGIKVVLNEFLGYLKMSEMIKAGLLSSRSVIIATYSLCGFANFGSLAILIGGIGSIAPERKKELASLGIKSIIAGTLASLMTATVAGILI